MYKNIIFVLIFASISLNGKIIEVKQLFNKKYTTVQEQSFGVSKIFYGKSVVDETKTKDINLRFDGFIKDLQANEEHKYIKKGDKLFSIYSKEIVSTFEELLLAKKFQKKQTLESIKRKLELLDVDKQTISRVLKTEKIPYYIDIHSKYSGIIIDKKIFDGGFIKQGSSIFKLADLTTLWVDINIYQKDRNFIKKGMQGRISIDGYGIFDSQVDFIHPFLDTKTNTITVRLKLQNKGLKLIPNLFATVTLKNARKTILVLPKTAVLTKGDMHYVFKPISNNQFEAVKVEAKRLDNSKFEIISGVSKGEKVIDNALFLLDSDAITNGLYETSSEDDEW